MDETFADLMAYIEARSQPREEVVQSVIQEIAALRRDGYLTDEQSAVLLREIT